MQDKVAKNKFNLQYFGEPKGSLFDAFKKSSKNWDLRKFTFYYTTDVACGKNYGLDGPGIALTRTFDESPLQFTGKADLKSVVSFAKNTIKPIVMPFDNDAILPIFDLKKPALILFSEDDNEAYLK